MIQVAEIDVQSAGGRNTGIAVQGKQADLQLLESRDQVGRHRQYDPYYYRYNGYNSSDETSIATGYAAFTTQPNLFPDSPDAFGIRVPITPWGFRKSTATAHDPKLRGLEVKLSYQPKSVDPNQMIDPSSSPVNAMGKWSVEISNQLPFDLTDCRVVLMKSRVEVSLNSQNNYGFGRVAQVATPTLRIVEGSATILIETLPASASRSAFADGLAFQDVQQFNQGYGQSTSANISLRATYKGATGAWFLGRISKSPLLSIDDKESDFEPLDEAHYITQEIYPEQLPREWLDQHQAWLDLQFQVAEQQLLLMQQSADTPAE